MKRIETTDLETKHASALPGVAYMSFTSGYSLSVAVSAFERKHGKPPRISFIDGKLLKLGPEPKRKSVLL